jgi:hypothetical protein
MCNLLLSFIQQFADSRQLLDKIGRNENRSFMLLFLQLFCQSYAWDLLKLWIDWQAFSRGNLDHEIRAGGSSTHSQHGIASFQQSLRHGMEYLPVRLVAQ